MNHVCVITNCQARTCRVTSDLIVINQLSTYAMVLEFAAFCLSVSVRETLSKVCLGRTYDEFFLLPIVELYVPCENVVCCFVSYYIRLLAVGRRGTWRHVIGQCMGKRYHQLCSQCDYWPCEHGYGPLTHNYVAL